MKKIQKNLVDPNTKTIYQLSQVAGGQSQESNNETLSDVEQIHAWEISDHLREFKNKYVTDQTRAVVKTIDLGQKNEHKFAHFSTRNADGSFTGMRLKMVKSKTSLIPLIILEVVKEKGGMQAIPDPSFEKVIRNAPEIQKLILEIETELQKEVPIPRNIV